MSEVPDKTPPWDSQGCAVCRRQWETAERPDFVAENTADHSALYRCAACGTLWLLTERAAAAVRPEDIRSAYPAVSAQTTAEYWRRSVASVDRYFKLLDGQDYILENDLWTPFHRYKSGPSWWRLTGEPDAEVIDAADLPPDAPT